MEEQGHSPRYYDSLRQCGDEMEALFVVADYPDPNEPHSAEKSKKSACRMPAFATTYRVIVGYSRVILGLC